MSGGSLPLSLFLQGCRSMKRIAVGLSLLFFVACASAPTPQPAVTTTVAPPPAPVHSANALTTIASVAKTIAEPRIRVGLVNDQTTVTFPRLAGGYYVITDTTSATIRRGFTLTAPVSDAALHYAVQVSTVSDLASANTLADVRHTTNSTSRASSPTAPRQCSRSS